MSKHPSHLQSTTLLALLVAASASASAACGSAAEPEQKRAWNCQTEPVPSGEVVRCTSAALVTLEPIPAAVYDCTGATPSADCPPYTDATSQATPPPTDPPATTPDAGGGGTASECAYVSELPSCAPALTDGSSSESASPPAEGCTNPPCSARGQQKKGDVAGGPPSESPPNSGADGGKGGGGEPTYHCEKDDRGSASCVSTPKCVRGTHPSACGACVDDGEAGDCVPPTEGGCWVTGGGFIQGPTLAPVATAADGNDNFGGNAKPMKSGSISGHWNHVDHGTGNHALGRPEYIMCRHVDEPGPGQPGGKKGLTANQVYFGGHASFRSNDTWGDGYWFDVVAKDHGEPGSVPSAKNGGMVDSYHFTLRKIDDPTKGASGTVVYETSGGLSGGNIQIHPSNNGHPAVSSPLPAWVGLEP